MPGSRSNVYWRVRVQRSVRPQTSDDDEVHASKKKYLAAIQYGTSSPGDTANTQISPTLEDSEHGSVDSVEIAHDDTCMQAVCDVFDTPELLEILLLPNITIKELGRTLSVSKQGQGTILSSPTLRRTLFLSHAPEKNYLDHTNLGIWSPVITCEPSQGSTLIIEPQQMLLENDGKGNRYMWQLAVCTLSQRTYMPVQFADIHVRSKHDSPHLYDILGQNMCTRIAWIHYDRLENVPPSTFLFQPPVADIRIVNRHRWRQVSVQQNGGVTFGALMDTLKTMLVEDKKVIARGDPADYRRKFLLAAVRRGVCLFRDRG